MVRALPVLQVYLQLEKRLMRERKTLDLDFRGERDYLHGTSMYAAATTALQSVAPGGEGAFEITFRRPAREQCDLVITDESSAATPEDIAADFELRGPGRTVRGWFVTNGATVARRTPYAEDDIVRSCDLNERGARMTRDSGFAPIEVVVAITKAFHTQSRPPGRLRWMFARLRLERLLRSADAGALSVTLEQELGARMTMSRIESNGAPIGHIFFALMVP